MSQASTGIELGQVVITPNAQGRIDSHEALTALGRHRSGDWGEVCPEDKKSNDEAVRDGERLLSVYRTANDEKFWIITERDRSVTTILMPEDY